MSKSNLFDRLKRLIAISKYANQHKLSSQEAIDRVLEQEKIRHSRRNFIKGSSAGLAMMAMGSGLSLLSGKAHAARTGAINIGIVGAGLAGLTAAYELKKAGQMATIYEVSERVGGRQFTLRNYFPGQVAERGGELIDSLHTTMLGYAREFNLELEDLSKEPGEVTYFFQGVRYPESVVVDQFRQFVEAMKEDLRLLSGEVTADSNTEYDRQLDQTSLDEYLDGSNSRGIVAGPVAREAIRQAYIAEYGLETSELSCLNFLFFIHADNRSKFTPFGVFSNERYHVLNGNDLIAQNIAQRLNGQFQFAMKLVRIHKTSSGKIELTFKQGSRTIVRSHDAAIISIPFTVLRDVEITSSVGLPSDQRHAINNLGYGYNAKMMVGFKGRPWYTQYNGSGAAYADLANMQTTWETNHAYSASNRAIITDYSGGNRGMNLNPTRPQSEAEKFLADFNRAFPGAANVVNRNNRGEILAHLEHWPSNPTTKGSYTAYRLGEFTTIAGLEGKPVDNLFFAGEHANSFYEWQGFMEGACLSGIYAAADVLK